MKIRTIICAAMALTLLGGTVARAQWEDDRYRNQHWTEHHDNSWHNWDRDHDRDWQRNHRHHWARGEHLDRHYVVVNDWRSRRYHNPPRGYHWVRTDDGDIVLAAIATGIIAEVLLNQH